MSDSDLLARVRSSQAEPEAPSAQTLAKRTAVAELRSLIHSIGSSSGSTEEFERLATAFRAHRESLGRAERPGVATGRVMLAGMEDFLDRSPMTGHANPMAPPATLAVDPDAERVRGEVRFGAAFEGAPGIVHGGFVAALLDEALGMACVFSGTQGMTVELTTRYRRHTPVATPLVLEAWLVSVEGRKIRTAGELRHGDERVAEASGLFIAVDVGKFEELAAARSEASG